MSEACRADHLVRNGRGVKRARTVIVAIACTLVLAACGSPDRTPRVGRVVAGVGRDPASRRICGRSDDPVAVGGFVGVGSSPCPTSARRLPPPFSDNETMVWIPAGDHRVPGTLALPAVTPGEKVPAVLLLHGDLSSRDENGDMFARSGGRAGGPGNRLAADRFRRFRRLGGTRPRPGLPGHGARRHGVAGLPALQDADVDPDQDRHPRAVPRRVDRATVAGTVPGVAALVSWSGAVYNGYDEDPDGHQVARENGYVPVDLGDRIFKLALAWFDTIESSHPLDDVSGYTGPVLAVVGSDDDVVPPEVSRSSWRPWPARTRPCTSSTVPTTASPPKATGTRPSPSPPTGWQHGCCPDRRPTDGRPAGVPIRRRAGPAARWLPAPIPRSPQPVGQVRQVDDETLACPR